MPPPKSTVKSTRRKSTGRSSSISQDSSPNLSFTDPLLNNNVLPSANSTFRASSIETHYSTNHSPEFSSYSHSPESTSIRQRIRNSVSPTNNFRTNSSYSPSVDPFDTGSDSDLNEVGKTISASSHFSHRKIKESDVPYLPSSLGTPNIRSRFQPAPRTSTALNSDNLSSYSSPKSGTGTSDVNSLFRSAQPYSSEFTRRLSASSRLGKYIKQFVFTFCILIKCWSSFYEFHYEDRNYVCNCLTRLNSFFCNFKERLFKKKTMKMMVSIKIQWHHCVKYYFRDNCV